MSDAPTPEEIYERTKEEGERRLHRPVLEEMSTAIAAGFDIVAGITILGLLQAQFVHSMGLSPAHVLGSIGFGVAFVFLVVGRGELFTENFLVPIAGLDNGQRHLWRRLLKLWTISPVFNVLGGLVVIFVLTTHGVLPNGSAHAIVHSADVLHSKDVLALFMSAIFAGALMTAMTWFVEGQESVGVRAAVAWIVGFVIALGYFNHVIVETIELIFGYRFGAHYPWTFIVWNFFLATAGNMVGGIGLVTLNRLTQGKSRRSA